LAGAPAQAERKPEPREGWQAEVRLLVTSEGRDPAGLVAGRDLALAAPLGHGLDLPHGVLLDDHLSQEARAGIDEEAIRRLSAWREELDGVLTVDEVRLAFVWEVELLAEVFLAGVRVVRGVGTALAGAPPRRLACEGLPPDELECLQRELSRVGVDVRASGPPGPPPRYPTATAFPWTVPPWRRVVGGALRTLGVPALPRGRVLYRHYPPLIRVFERLLAEPDLAPVLDPLGLPLELGARRLARAALTGGWAGHPGWMARRRSRHQVRRALEAAADRSDDQDPIGRLLHHRGLSLLRQRGQETPAYSGRLRRTLASHKARLVLLPFDSPPEARLVLEPAKRAGVPTLVVQHGAPYPPGNDPDRSTADRVAVWSEHDLRELGERAPGAEVIGNPAAPAGVRPRRPGNGRTVILVDGIRRLSARVDWRVGLRHVDAALAALERARPGTTAVIRPHPAEFEPEVFLRPAQGHPGVDAVVDTTSTIAELAEQTDLCVAAVSTAALQLGVAGVPVICLNVSGAPTPWPLDGSGDVPLAHDSEELTRLMDQVLASPGVPGQGELAESLGMAPEALERLVALVRRAAGRHTDRRHA
jgi:hypothetical protein